MTIESFNTAIGDNARFLARFDAVTGHVSATLAAEGLTLSENDREALKGLPSVKLAVFGEEPLDQSVLDAAKRLPDVAEQLRRREVATLIEKGDKALHADLSRMSRSARMTLAREIDAERKAQTARTAPPTMSVEEEAVAIRILRSISSPAVRISMAREMGFLK